MLEIFGSVFGRIKKTSKQEGSSEDFVASKDQSKVESSLYPSINHDQTGQASPSSLSSPLANGYYAIERSISTPLDGITFIRNINLPNSNNKGSTNMNLEQCFAIIERIGVFLNSPSLSDYDFRNERTFLSQYQ